MVTARAVMTWLALQVGIWLFLVGMLVILRLPREPAME